MFKKIKSDLKKKNPNVFYFFFSLKYFIRNSFLFLRFPVLVKFKDLYEEIKQVKADTVKGNNILFFSARQEPDHLFVLTILRWSLNLRGNKTFVLGCDKAIPTSCNSGSAPSLNKWQCAACYNFASTTHNLTGAEAEWMRSYVTESDRKSANDIVNNLQYTDFKEFEYRGYKVGDLVRVSVAHFLKANTIDSATDSVIQIYRDWIKSAITLVDSFTRYLEEKNPDIIFMLNGLFSAERIMLEIARKRNIDVITYEVGFMPETFFFRKNEPINMCNNNYWSDFKDKELTPVENIRLNEYNETRNSGKGYLINYFPNISADKVKIENEFNFSFTKKTFLLFPNITWDSTLFNCDIVFDSMINWINETIRYFINKPDCQLIIRTHPAEAKLENADREPVIHFITKEFNKLPSNIIIIPSESQVSSYVLMDHSYCGLVYGSTTGIEMGLRGIPVIVTGKIYYRGLGVSIDPDTKEEYFNILENLCNDTYSFNKSQSTEIWRRYAYFAIFRSALKLPYFDYPSTNKFPSIELTSIEKLRPGVSKDLDIICDGITKGTRFIKS